jgi:hypothetical protein
MQLRRKRSAQSILHVVNYQAFIPPSTTTSTPVT